MFATLSAASTQSPGVQMLLSELPSVLRALAAGLAAAPKSCLICLSQLLSADRAAMHAHAELWLPGVVEFVLDELKKARLADAEAARTKGAQALQHWFASLMVLSDWVADAEWAHARHVPCARFRIMSSPACALIPSGALAPCLRFCSCWTK